jgi:hypothetical protein
MTTPHVPTSHDTFSIVRVPLSNHLAFTHLRFSSHMLVSVHRCLVLRLGHLRLLLTTLCQAALRIAEEALCWFFRRALTVEGVVAAGVAVAAAVRARVLKVECASAETCSPDPVGRIAYLHGVADR